MLRRVFGSKRDEVTGEWRKLHNEELSDLYSLPNIVGFTLSQATKALRENRGIALLYFRPLH